jgi:hypothetical protein
MGGAIPPLRNMPPWRGAQLNKKKHRDNFTFTLRERQIQRISQTKRPAWPAKSNDNEKTDSLPLTHISFVTDL